MALSLKNEFSQLAKSSAFDDALKEPDFLGRATKLFNLRESLWTAVTRTEDEINDVTSARIDKHSRLIDGIGFGIAAIAAFACTVAFFTPAAVLAGGAAAFFMSMTGVPSLVLGAVVGMGAGFYGALTTAGLATIKPQRDADKARDALRAQNDKLQARIGQEIDAMDKSLFSQDTGTQEKFRAAFKEAAFKQGIRDNSVAPRPKRGLMAWMDATYALPESQSTSTASSDFPTYSSGSIYYCGSSGGLSSQGTTCSNNAGLSCPNGP